jgi:hypothetical protein
MKNLKIYGLIIINLGLFIPLIAQAQVLPPCTATGNCGLCEFIQAFVNIVRWVLGVAGGSALLLLIWHGITWISSGGNKDKVDAGRKGLINTIIGLGAIIGSWFLVNTVLTILLTTPEDAAQGKITQTLFDPNNSSWFQFCKGTGNSFCQKGWGEGTPCGSGKFCLKRGTKDANGQISNYEMTCDNTNEDKTLTYLNVCHYWAKYPGTPTNLPRLEYKDYQCVNSTSECVGGKILGKEYCTDNKVCCYPTVLNPSGGFQVPTIQGSP